MPTTTERRWYFDEFSRAILDKPDPNMPGQYCSTVVLKIPDEYRPEHAAWKQVVADGKLAAAAPYLLEACLAAVAALTCQTCDDADDADCDDLELDYSARLDAKEALLAAIERATK